jgi:hypothetical protein
MIHARRVTIHLFDGESYRVEQDVNAFLQARGAQGGAERELVSIQYNYQAPEVNESGDEVGSATHGVCVVLAERLEVNQ